MSLSTVQTKFKCGDLVRKMFEKRMKGYRAMGYEALMEGARLPLFLTEEPAHPEP